MIYLKVDLALQYETGGDLSNFMPNGEWSLIGEREGEREKLSTGDIKISLACYLFSLSQKINLVSSILPLSSDQPYGFPVIGLL